MKKALTILFVLFLGLSVSVSDGYAVDDDYDTEVMLKLSRGVTNVLFGWTEILGTPTRMVDQGDHGVLSASLFGVPYGLLRFVGRTVVGAFEVLTFYAPSDPVFSDIKDEIPA